MNNILKKEKTKTKGCLGFSILLIIGIFIFIIYPLFLQQHILITSKSPDNSYKIIIKYKDPFFFGAHEINVYYKKNKDIFKHNLFTAEICNDGATIDESNYNIKWNNNIAEIGFIGEEQRLESYKIDFSEKVKYEMIKSKYDD